jgi:hypothetical protein
MMMIVATGRLNNVQGQSKFLALVSHPGVLKDGGQCEYRGSDHPHPLQHSPWGVPLGRHTLHLHVAKRSPVHGGSTMGKWRGVH